MSILLKSARIGATVILSALLSFALYNSDSNTVSDEWLDYLVPLAWMAMIATGWADGFRAVFAAAVCSAALFAIAAALEREDGSLPQCGSLMDAGPCQADVLVQAALVPAFWVLVVGGAASAVAAAWRSRRGN